MHLQNFLNVSEIKLPPASDIIIFGNPNYENLTLHAIIKFLQKEICYYSLQCIGHFLLNVNMSATITCQGLPENSDTLFSLLVAFAESEGM